MAKGLFTQGMCVLLRRPLSTADIKQRLKAFSYVGLHESIEDDDARQTLVFEYRPEVNGHLLVTPSSAQWPDDMGDPELAPERFVAWSLGQFGPLAFPGCLQRAGEQSWGWEEGASESETHTAHVRLLVSYVLGANEPEEDESDDEVPLIPEDYDPMDELKFLTRAVSDVLEAPEAICYFNPGGEVLRDETGLREGLNYAWRHELPPLDMYTNVRIFPADEPWVLMDTVGNGQFDLPDMEAIYDTNKYQPRDVERLLRMSSLYLLRNEEDFQEGELADGPGDVAWMVMECYDSLTDPPRPTIRWLPQDGTTPPAELLDRGSEDVDEDSEIDDSDDMDDDLDEGGFGHDLDDDSDLF